MSHLSSASETLSVDKTCQNGPIKWYTRSWYTGTIFCQFQHRRFFASLAAFLPSVFARRFRAMHNKVCIIDSGTRIWKDFIHGEVFFAFLFLHFPISHYLLCLLFALGNKQTTPEQITTIVYAKMWETERNMKNWKKREC